jgi:CheY-like chemotaxis protein
MEYPEGGPVVLLVDDDLDYLQVVKHFLMKKEISVKLAPGGLQALEAIRTGEKFDLMLLDLRMPEADAFAVLRDMKSSAEYRGVPVFVITASVVIEPELRREIISLGAEDLVQKSFEVRDLISRVCERLKVP